MIQLFVALKINWRKTLMKLQKFLSIILFLVAAIFISACSKETGNQKDKPKEINKVPTDEILFKVVEDNLKALENENVEAYMATIHPESPEYENSEQLVKGIISTYKLKYELSDMKVIEKSEKEAKVYYVQKSIKVEGPIFQNNEVRGYHILKPDKDKWKIYRSIIRETKFLDEDGNPIDESSLNQPEGKYKDYINQLEFTIDDREWKLDHYDEGGDQALAEFTLKDESVENWSELWSIHFFENGAVTIGVDPWIEHINKSLDQVTQNMTFHRLDANEQEGIYEFIVVDDPIEDDQHEVARVFVHENHLYVVRYTILGPKMDKGTRDQWIERLKAVKVK